MASAKSLQRLCRETLPLMLQQANGQQRMAAVRDVVQTDRWNSFDRFGDTTATLTSYYEAAGARVEVESIQTGGRIGSGRWIIREAADVVGATVDVVHPLAERVLDWQENPWHVIQWSAATPASGLRLRARDSRPSRRHPTPANRRPRWCNCADQARPAHPPRSFSR